MTYARVTADQLEQFMIVSLSDEITSITTGVAKVTICAPFNMVLTRIPVSSLSTASSSGLPTVDIKKNSTTILGANKLSIDATELTSSTAATPTTLATSTVTAGDQLTFDITVAGTGAKGLKVTLYYRKA